MKRKLKKQRQLKTLGGGAMVLAMAGSLHADGAASTNTPAASVAAPVAAEPGTLDSFFNQKLPDAIGKSKISVNARLRYEYADTAATTESHAPTLRTRFGLTTAPLHGFQGMIEGENVSVLGDLNNARYPGQPNNGKTVVADPPTTEINQAWVSYANTNWHTTVKAGRQRIVLDNFRFIGDVGWRQNQQTFDAVTLTAAPLENLHLFYGWIGRVNRIFGNVNGLPGGLKDFQSNSHLLNAAYDACGYAKITAYTYLLDLSNGAGNNQSCATYGFNITGKAKVSDKVTLNYAGEFAYQTDYADSTLNYDAIYYNFQVGAAIKPVTFGGGIDVLGSDGGKAAFQTPLATLHAWNGWADVFLSTPATGLRDIYAFAQVTIPGAQIPVKVVYHKFDADSGSADYGQEVDLVASKKLGKHWTTLAKYAHFDGQDTPYVDVDKFWLEMDFVF